MMLTSQQMAKSGKSHHYAQRSIIYSEVHTANIQMLHACVKLESNIQGCYRPKVHAQECPIIGSETSPVMSMTCFTSQLMSLRLIF